MNLLSPDWTEICAQIENFFNGVARPYIKILLGEESIVRPIFCRFLGFTEGDDPLTIILLTRWGKTHNLILNSVFKDISHDGTEEKEANKELLKRRLWEWIIDCIILENTMP